MSLLLDQAATYLETEGLGVVGRTIFKGNRPPSPVACLSIHQTGGYTPDPRDGRERPTLQFMARGATEQAAYQTAYNIWNKLAYRNEVDLGGGIVALTIDALGSPSSLGEEAPGTNLKAFLVVFNLLFDLRRSSS
jgi:hypothetical protein